MGRTGCFKVLFDVWSNSLRRYPSQGQIKILVYSTNVRRLFRPLSTYQHVYHTTHHDNASRHTYEQHQRYGSDHRRHHWGSGQRHNIITSPHRLCSVCVHLLASYPHNSVHNGVEISLNAGGMEVCKLDTRMAQYRFTARRAPRWIGISQAVTLKTKILQRHHRKNGPFIYSESAQRWHSIIL